MSYNLKHPGTTNGVNGCQGFTTWGAARMYIEDFGSTKDSSLVVGSILLSTDPGFFDASSAPTTGNLRHSKQNVLSSMENEALPVPCGHLPTPNGAGGWA